MPTLHWIGKDKVVNHHQEVPFRMLEHTYSFDEQGQHSQDNHSENMIVKGDNLEALKALLPMYEGKIKCIYIDPPYNTGNEGWVYNDNVNDPRIKKWLGDVVGREGEDLTRHDKWLCMMYPRLRLLHRLLADDGIIFISIDDNEQANLRLICDEVFGMSNFVIQVVWQKRTSPEARKIIGTAHDYVIVYAKNSSLLSSSLRRIELNDKDRSMYKNPDNDPKGPWTSTDFTAQGYRPNQMYEIITPSGKRIVPPQGRCWKNLESGYEELLADGRLWFGSNGDGVPRQKNYLAEKEGQSLWSWWPNTEVGHSQEGTKELSKIMGTAAIFDYPKPSRLISRIVQIATLQDSLVMDSFAGSGTTAHAVLNLNKQDGGKRKFILIEMMDYADSITAERVKRVIQGYGEGNKVVEGTGGSFSYYELGEPLLNANDTLNESVGIDKIRAYVWHTETRTPYRAPESSAHPHLLGSSLGTDYYFNYEKGRTTTLSLNYLGTIRKTAEHYVIYADINALSEAELLRHNITFKKIPRDIARI